MELARRRLRLAAGTAAVAALAVTAPSALAATPKQLEARAGSATFSTSYRLTKQGGKLTWALVAPKLGKGPVAVRLIVPYKGKPLALTLCTACRSTENGQAVVAGDLAKLIGAGKATVEIVPARGSRLTAPLRP